MVWYMIGQGSNIFNIGSSIAYILDVDASKAIEVIRSRAINTNYGVLKLYSDGVSKWFII